MDPVGEASSRCCSPWPSWGRVRISSGRPRPRSPAGARVGVIQTVGEVLAAIDLHEGEAGVERVSSVVGQECGGSLPPGVVPGLQGFPLGRAAGSMPRVSVIPSVVRRQRRRRVSSGAFHSRVTGLPGTARSYASSAGAGSGRLPSPSSPRTSARASMAASRNDGLCHSSLASTGPRLPVPLIASAGSCPWLILAATASAVRRARASRLRLRFLLRRLGLGPGIGGGAAAALARLREGTRRSCSGSACWPLNDL